MLTRQVRVSARRASLAVVALAVVATGLAVPGVAVADTISAVARSGTQVEITGNTPWSNPNHITSNVGGLYATAVLPNNAPPTNYLRASDFGLELPDNATVTGIQVRIVRQASAANSPFIRDHIVQLVDGSGAIVGTNRANTATNWPTTMGEAVYSGDLDWWGASSLTIADIEDEDFGVVLSAARSANGPSRTASVDYLEVTVTYTPPSATYTLTYTAGTGGQISGTSPQTVAYGGSGTPVMAVADPGYYFVAWSDGVTTAMRTDTMVTSDISVTANFAPLTYTLTYTAGTGGTIDGTSPQTVTYGGSGTPVTAVPDAGYQFTNWSDGVMTATRTDTSVTADLSVTANFVPLTYALTYTAVTGGQISGTSPQTVAYGGSGTPVMAVADPGYYFVAWSDGVTTAMRTDTMVTSDISVTANFVPITYTLTYTAGTGGTIDGTSPQTVAYGGSGTPVTAVADAGYQFTNWSDGVMTATRTDTSVTADLSVTANFAINTYTVTFEDWDGSVLKTETVEHGGSATAPADPTRTGYTFAGWSDDFSSITADLTVTALYDINTYTLTYTADTGGTIDGTSPQTVTYGGSGTPVTAIPNSGYTFVKWSDDVMTATRTDTNVTGDLSVTALFAPDVPTTYTLTYTAGNGGTISGTSPQTLAHGGSGTPVTAVADAGYQFTNWSDGVMTATRTDANVTANLSVTANFTPDAPTYPLVYPFDGGQVVFTQVTSAGSITVTRLAPRHPDPVGYRLLVSSYHEITVNHTFSGSATVSIEYQTSELAGAPESGLRMFRWTGTSWQQLPSMVDTASKVVSGTTTQFSDFAVATPTSTEPPVVSTPASSTRSLVVLALLGVALVFAARLRWGDSRA